MLSLWFSKSFFVKSYLNKSLNIIALLFFGSTDYIVKVLETIWV